MVPPGLFQKNVSDFVTFLALLRNSNDEKLRIKKCQAQLGQYHNTRAVENIFRLSLAVPCLVDRRLRALIFHKSGGTQNLSHVYCDYIRYNYE